MRIRRRASAPPPRKNVHILYDTMPVKAFRYAWSHAEMIVLSDQLTQAESAEVLGEMLRTTPTRAQRQRRRRVLIAAVSAAALVGATAASTVRSRSTGDPTRVRCYTRADINDKYVGTTVFPIDEQPDPEGLCASLWQQAAVMPGPTPSDLTACVLFDGVTAVFPGGPKTCQVLGLPALADSAATAR